MGIGSDFLESRAMVIAEAAAWAVGGLLAALSLYFVSLNLACVYRGLAKGEHHSLGPLVGGASGSLAMLLLPIPGLRVWAWVPLVIDPGCLYTVVAFAYVLVRERYRG